MGLYFGMYEYYGTNTCGGYVKDQYWYVYGFSYA